MKKLGDLVRDVADCIDGDDESAAVAVLDREFIFGAWKAALAPDESTKNKLCDYQKLRNDIRGLIVAMYKEGWRRRQRVLDRVVDALSDGGAT